MTLLLSDARGRIAAKLCGSVIPAQAGFSTAEWLVIQ